MLEKHWEEMKEHSPVGKDGKGHCMLWLDPMSITVSTSKSDAKFTSRL